PKPPREAARRSRPSRRYAIRSYCGQAIRTTELTVFHRIYNPPRKPLLGVGVPERLRLVGDGYLRQGGVVGLPRQLAAALLLPAQSPVPAQLFPLRPVDKAAARRYLGGIAGFNFEIRPAHGPRRPDGHSHLRMACQSSSSSSVRDAFSNRI